MVFILIFRITFSEFPRFFFLTFDGDEKPISLPINAGDVNYLFIIIAFKWVRVCVSECAA